jgi:hypothetical protein
MGKGSGTCDRPGIALGVSDDTETKAILNMDVAEVNTTLELQRVEHRWFTKDERVTYHKREEGWVVFSFSPPVRKAFEEYGIIHQQPGVYNSYEHTYFPSLKAARQAVNDVSLEAELNIDTSLTRQKYVAYKIGDLPLRIRKDQGHWRVHAVSSAQPQSLQNHFNSTQECLAAWQSTDSAFAHYPTRKAAHQAVLNWLSQTITEEE